MPRNGEKMDNNLFGKQEENGYEEKTTASETGGEPQTDTNTENTQAKQTEQYYSGSTPQYSYSYDSVNNQSGQSVYSSGYDSTGSQSQSASAPGYDSANGQSVYSSGYDSANSQNVYSSGYDTNSQNASASGYDSANGQSVYSSGYNNANNQNVYSSGYGSTGSQSAYSSGYGSQNTQNGSSYDYTCSQDASYNNQNVYGNQNTQNAQNTYSYGYQNNQTAQDNQNQYSYGTQNNQGQAGYQNQNPYATQTYGQNNTGYQGYQPEMEEPVKMGDWLLLQCLLSFIPCVGIILAIVWAFSKTEKQSKVNFCKAYLIVVLIRLAIALVLIVLYGSIFIAALDGAF